MTATAMLDLRRTDLRTNVLENPYWITSKEMTKACDDKAAVLFSFPITRYGDGPVIIVDMVIEVVAAFTGGTIACTWGKCTIATEAETTTTVVVDEDEYVATAQGSSDLTGPGIYYPGASDYQTDRLLMQYAAGYVITPLDALVPAVAVYLTSDGVITTGSAYLHMLINVPPVLAYAA